MSVQTRASLLQRLCADDDRGAWTDFVSIYEPVIYRLARGRGLQDADAREVTQDVLLAVSAAIHRFDPAGKARFSGWLATITRNATIDRLRRRRDVGSGGSEMLQTLHQLAAPSEQESAEFDWEHNRQLFRWAAAQVQQQVNQATWQAFWKTAVEGQAVTTVARDLSVSVGTVYVSRCRVLAKIKAIVAEVNS